MKDENSQQYAYNRKHKTDLVSPQYSPCRGKQFQRPHNRSTPESDTGDYFYAKADERHSKVTKLEFDEENQTRDYEDEKSPPPPKRSSGPYQSITDFFVTLRDEHFDSFTAGTRRQSKAARYNKNGERRKPYNMQGKHRAKREEHKIPKKRSKLLDKHEVAARFKEPCCINECVWWGFSIEKMMVIRGRYVMQIEKERTAWLHIAVVQS